MERAKWSTGPHLLEFEPPDLFHYHVCGTVLASDINGAYRVMREEVIPNVGDVYLLVHMKDIGTEAMPKETRDYLVTLDLPAKGTVVIGGARLARTALAVLAQAVTAISSKPLLIKVVGTDEEALDCVKKWRSASASHRAD